MDTKINGTPATCHILTNSPALHSLKRQQLVQLCKRNGIKASGKNSEIVEKLKAYAHNMNIDPSAFSEQTISSDDENKENRKVAMPRPSDQWTIIEEDSREVERVQLGLKEIREEVRQEIGSIASLRSFGTLQSSGDFGTSSSKGASMTSSLKAFATSLKRSNSKLASAPTSGTNLSTATISNIKPSLHTDPPMNDPLAVTSTPYRELPPTYPVFPDPEPLNAEDSRDQSMLELGASTIRLVSSVPVAESPPALQPFTSTFDPSYSPMSPLAPSIYPSLPVDSDSDFGLPGAYPSGRSTPAPPKPSASPSLQPATPFLFGTPSLHPPTPFLFGTPSHRISNTEFNSAAASVLAEMNARLGLTGTSNEVGLDILQTRHVEPEPATLPSRQEKPRTDVTSKFDRAHEREFERMEGLGAWYAKRGGASLNKPCAPKNKKRKSDVLGNQARRPSGPSNIRGRRTSRVVTPGNRRSLVAAATSEVDGRKGKRIRISTVERGDARAATSKSNEDGSAMDMDGETQEANDEREKERAAIRKKLEVSRARRRSSMGRVSVGAGRPALIPNQPKKGTATKFGFLSSAKTLVKNVWKGVGTTTGDPHKPVAPTKPKTTSSVAPKKSAPNVLTKAPPALKPSTMKTTAAKVPTTKSDASTSLRAPPTSLGLGKKEPARTRTDSFAGTKSSAASSARTWKSTASSGSAIPIARRAPIPSFQPPAGRVSRTNSLVNGGTTGSRTSAAVSMSSRGGSMTQPGSLGIRKPGPSVGGSTDSVVRKRASTIFAPTVSSLAKMQSTVKPPSLTGLGSPNTASTGARGLAKVSEHSLPPQNAASSVNSTALPSSTGALAPNGSIQIAPDQISVSAPKRVLSSRRPRISRSRVIARVGAQRAASGSSLSSNASTRRSLNIAKPRSSISSRASGVSRGKDVAAAMSARKRLRQSEILRRRSKVGGMSPVLNHMARENFPGVEESSDNDDGRDEERSLSMNH